jgi:hypothetical protein
MAGFKNGGLVEQVATIATSGSSDILVYNSIQNRTYTGTVAQTIQFPDATTMTVGQKFEIFNNATQALFTRFNDSTLLKTIAPGYAAVFKLVNNSTTNGIWTIVSNAVGVAATSSIVALDIDWSLSNSFTKSISGATAFTFSNMTDGQIIRVAVTLSGSSIIITWPVGTLWSSGTAPSSTGGGKTDIFTFTKIGSNIYGSVVLNY